MDKYYYVYIVSSKSKVLYVGVTNNLRRRIQEHKEKIIKGFTAKYNVKRIGKIWRKMRREKRSKHF